ncbi:MAG: ArnT family glycosyltransferase [Rhizomicrobium sp.]
MGQVGVAIPQRAPAWGSTISGAPSRALAFIGVLTVVRFATAVYLPLSFDESYFWLWSKHLAVSYYDHPPLIALAIRAGTLIFGDTAFGVRFVSLLASVAATWAVWRAGTILVQDKRQGAFAACLFNATLMVAAESMSATPDALVLASSALTLLFVARAQAGGDGRWWLAAGLAIGLALFSKYTAVFLGAGVALWLAASPQGRKWLRTPWPYAALAIALSFTVSTILWNAAHDWISFKFQFGRVIEGQATLRYLAEFLAGQLALASPFILALSAVGLVRQTRWNGVSLAAALAWPAIAYFAIHALHDRVQGNWPSFIYPSLAILAAGALPANARDVAVSWARRAALPVACVILAVSYTQVATGVLSMGRYDPVDRMTGIGIAPVATQIEKLSSSAAGIVTMKYATASWLSFYVRPGRPVIEMAEDYRWIAEPAAGESLLGRPLIFVTQSPKHELAEIKARFSQVTPLAVIDRKDHAAVVDRFYVYAVSGFHGQPEGHIVNGH